VGSFVWENLAAAVRYFLDLKKLREAAEKGDAEAQYSLGLMYREGRGVPKDDVEAEDWFRKAAGQGFAKAQDSLAVMHRDGVVSPTR
jgi:TPR repeat protein